MTTSRSALVFTVTLLAGAITCNSSDSPSVIHLADDLARAFCKHQFRCCSPAEIGEVAEGRYATEADCLAFAKLSAEHQLAVLDNAIGTGHVTIEANAAAACVAKYEMRSCNTSLQEPEQIQPVPDVAQALAACPGLLVGHVPAGVQCTLAEECISGTRCFVGSSPTPTGTGGIGGFRPAPSGSNGACVPARRVGEICNETADCDARLFCKKPEFVCTPRARAGEPCGFDFPGQAPIECDSADGLSCDFSARVCRRRPRASEPCLQFQFPQCDPDPALALSCNRLTGTCMASAGPGEPCGALALPPCRAELSCIPTQSDGIGTCGTPPGEGSPCLDKCASPAACELATNVCRMPGSKPIGATCSDKSECVTLVCDAVASTTRVCIPSGRPAICMGSVVTPGSQINMGVGGGMGPGAAGTFGAAGFNGAAGDLGTAGTGAGGVTGAGGTEELNRD